jgi:hypothetical protein
MTPPIFLKNLFSDNIIHTTLFLYMLHFVSQIVIVKLIIVNKIRLNKVTQENKWIFKANINEFDYLVNEVLEINMFIVSKVKLIKNFEQWWVDIGATIHVYTMKKMFFLQRSWWRKLIHEVLVNLQDTKCWKSHTKDDLKKAFHL